MIRGLRNITLLPSKAGLLSKKYSQDSLKVRPPQLGPLLKTRDMRLAVTRVLTEQNLVILKEPCVFPQIWNKMINIPMTYNKSMLDRAIV